MGAELTMRSSYWVVALLLMIQAGSLAGQAPAVAQGQPEAAGGALSSTPRLLTIRIVADMVSLKMPDKQILGIVANHPNSFNFSDVNQLELLHEQYGFSTTLLEAMIGAQGTNRALARKALADYQASPVAAAPPQIAKLSEPRQPGAPSSSQGPAPMRARGQLPAQTVAAQGKEELSPDAPTLDHPPLTIDDVQRLVVNKVPTETIVKIIHSSPGDYHLQTDADFEAVARRGFPNAVDDALVEVSGPSAMAALAHFQADEPQRKASAASAEQKRIADSRARIKHDCPGCLIIMFFHWDAKTKQNYPNELPPIMLADEHKFDDLAYARAHHLFVTQDISVAEYQVVWSTWTFTFHEPISHYQSEIGSDGEWVSVYTGTTMKEIDNPHYVISVFGPDLKKIYETQKGNMGFFKMHNADLDCWHNTQKFLSKLHDPSSAGSTQ
jgi:hypothetical protein